MSFVRPSCTLASLFFVICAAVGVVSAPPAVAQGGVVTDCTDVKVDYQADPNLTRQEQLEQMDRAFEDSLRKFEACQTGAAGGGASQTMNGAGDGAGGGAGSAADATGSGNSGDGVGSADSVANSDMSGTEAPSQSSSSGNGSQLGNAGDGSGTWGNPDAGSSAASSETASGQTGDVGGNGRVPADIPPADNDSALEEQIRQAATNEPDPVVREKLWDEYRKYKGLPLKKP